MTTLASYLARTLLVASCAGVALAQELLQDPVLARVPPLGRVDVQGITVELRATQPHNAGGPLVAGKSARVAFHITDTATGSPQRSLAPGAWIHLADPMVSCQDKARSFLSGGMTSRAAMDLNAFYVLGLNHDATITVVDPLFGYGGTKLLALVELQGPGEDWVLDESSDRLFVSMPTAGAIAVVSTRDWKCMQTLKCGLPRPNRVAIQPDGHYLWALCDGPMDTRPIGTQSGDTRSGVAVFDARSLDPVAEIATGAGHHEIAFSADSRFAYVTDETSGTVSVIDVWSLAVTKRVAVGGRPVSVAYSPLSRAVYVVDAECGSISVLDERTHELLTTIDAEPGLGRISFAPGGRLGFVPSTRENVVHVIDSSSHRIVQTADVGARPDQVTFTESLAYVRSQGSELVRMIPLQELGRPGAPVPVVDFSGGQAAFGASRPPALADGIVAAPGGTAVLVANPADRAIYYYREGMAAPMGNFENYGREPRAVLVVDRSLREREPGNYATDVELSASGTLDVVFFLDAPRIVTCFTLDVAPNTEGAELARGPSLSIEPLASESAARARELQVLRFLAREPANVSALAEVDDLVALIFNTAGWQRRQPVPRDGDGSYMVSFTPPRSGTYYVCFGSPSKKLRFADLRPFVLDVDEALEGSAR